MDISEPAELERDYTPAHHGHSYSIGVNPLASFPNDKLTQDGDRKAVWSAPHKEDHIEELRNAVQNADWNMFYSQGKTRSLVSSSWSSSGDRCDKLREICTSSGAVRVLEIGSFCGVAGLTMAEVLPAETGSMLSLECDPFLVDFGLDIKVKSDDFWKITYMVGPARESLKNLVERVQEKDWEPFDLVVIDADKAGIVDYFEIVADTPGFMCETCLVCVDVTPYKFASVFTSYVKHGKAADFVISSGQSEINALRKCAASSGAFEVSEGFGMLFAQRRASVKKENLSIGANPFAAFPNDQNNMLRTQSFLQRWVGPESALPLAELRNAVHNEDWGALFSDGATQIRVEPFWCATPERCEKLQSLCRSSGAKSVLEVGTFCGVAALSMAEALAEDARIISLDLDPFVIDFGQEFKDKSPAWKKVSHMVGSAKESIKKLVAQSSGDSWMPFDLVVLDADKESMLDYFRLLWESPGMLAENPVICVDTTPFKGQLYVPFVKGKLDDFIVKSGQNHIDAFHAYVRAVPDLEMTEASGLAVVQMRD